MDDRKNKKKNKEDTTALLEALQKLSDAGVLTEREFQHKVQQIRDRYRRKTSKALNGIERRKVHRKQVRYFLSILDRNTKEQIGLLVDLTTKGAMLIRETPLELDKVYHLRILFSDPIDDVQHIDIDGISTWSEKDINPGFFATGIKFIKVSEENKRLIIRLINEFGVMSMDEPRL